MAPLNEEWLDAMEALRTLDGLIDEVTRTAGARCEQWGALRADYQDSALNLAAYLALRSHDLRALQRSLMLLGLSSLGRLESRVLPALHAVRASLNAVATGRADGRRPDAATFFGGQNRLRARARDLLGGSERPVGLLVTCPSEAADDPAFMAELARLDVEAVRINCAHDDAARWARMVDHAHRVTRASGGRLQVFMDVAGPKVRTGRIEYPGEAPRLHRDDEFALVASGGMDGVAQPLRMPAVECTLAEPVTAARVGHRVYYDDGKFQAVVTRVEAWGVVLRVETCAEKGVRLKPEKGLNFPDTEFNVDPLTDQDLADLDFIATHADCVEYSFVQSVEDVDRLQEALAARSKTWQHLTLVLKIETSRAVAALPDLLVRAAARQPVALMIARGDLALEIGYARLAEMQEEILWLAEAAQVPVIWATQVLERQLQQGVPSRAEETDAAMAARAECVMLNKGPHVFDVIASLNALVARMHDHQHKKTPQLRRLQSWT